MRRALQAVVGIGVAGECIRVEAQRQQARHFERRISANLAEACE
jgi:hypothetical protein